jgi:hypothetical protein
MTQGEGEFGVFVIGGMGVSVVVDIGVSVPHGPI